MQNSEFSQTPIRLSRHVAPFAWTALAWLFLSAALCWTFSDDSESAIRAVQWMMLLSVLSWLDLFSLAKTVALVLSLVVSAGSGANENRAVTLFKTSTWGVLKLACLLLFGVILHKGQAIPTVGLLSGMATLLIVPLFGGLFWNHRWNR